jgi:HEAT repeat protein
MMTQTLANPDSSTIANVNSSTLVVDSLHHLGQSGDRQFVPLLIELLQTTANPLIWNAAAIALSDLGDPIAVQPILALLKDPKTEGFRGTLVYALGEFDCQAIVLDLVEMMVSGNVEVSEQAFSIVENCGSRLAADVVEQVQRSVSAVMPQVSVEKQELLQDLLALFEG